VPDRNLYGYGANPPAANWPGGARVAVSFVLNVEEGSERAVSRGDPDNEAIYEMVQEVVGRPNPVMESHFDYGTRAGYWRIARVLERYGATCCVNACAEAFALSPWLARDAVARGWEIMCHGWRWETTLELSEAEMRDRIHRSVRTIQEICGIRPVGWHSRIPYSPYTRPLIVEEGGFLYDSDAYDDDLPHFVDVGGRRHLVLPYCLDTNDMRFQIPEVVFVRGKDFADYTNDAFDCLWEEGETSPKMLTIGLHLRIVGRPARIGGLGAILRHMTQKGQVWFARRDEIARHWIGMYGSAAPCGTVPRS
jgi:peptidoglycan/xylan/chitin deacetylase (PgdA/CDA1 family)